jgi:hypothetical protein
MQRQQHSYAPPRLLTFWTLHAPLAEQQLRPEPDVAGRGALVGTRDALASAP